MKTITLNIIKKGRVWFQCETLSGYKCKLKVNEISEAFTAGNIELMVEDVSVRSKYGTDLKYSPVGESKASDGIVAISHPIYNKILVEKSKSLGGKWDSDERSWIFPYFMSDKVEELEELFNDEKVLIELTYPYDHSVHCDSVAFCGYTIARATGRDSGAVLGDNVFQLSGKITSRGSIANWYSMVESGSVFRIEVPKLLLETYGSEDTFHEYKILQ